jgi:hypothetical protein
MNKHLTLVRQPSTDLGTQGELFSEDKMFHCYTIERPWADNSPQLHSSIPTGTYRCRRGQQGEFPKHPGSFEIMGVPNRSTILFHVANTMDDLLGCVGIGDKWGTLVGSNPAHPEHVGVSMPAVLGSKSGYARFMAFLEGEDEFMLTIQEVDA